MLLLWLSSRPSLRDEMGGSRYLIVFITLLCWARQYLGNGQVPSTRERSNKNGARQRVQQHSHDDPHRGLRFSEAMPPCSEMRHVAGRSSFSASIEPIAKLVMNLARALFTLSHRNRLLHMLCWRREKKQSMEQPVVAPSLGAQPLRRGAGDASDGALHTSDDMVHTRIMS